MAIHVIQSQRIDVLLDSMLRIVNQSAKNPLAVLQPRHFIVPSPAVEAWLTQKIAEKKGHQRQYPVSSPDPCLSMDFLSVGAE